MVDVLPVGFRELPNNVDAEQALLGAILINNEGYHRVAHLLRADHFYEPVHRRIYAKIIQMIEEGQLADAITLRFAFKNDESLKEVDGSKYLDGIARAAETVLNVEDYANVIRDLATRRVIIQVAQQASNRAYEANEMEEAGDQLATIERDLEWLKEQGGSDAAAFRGMDIVTASECPRPVRNWIIDQYIPEGYLTLLAGDSGLGKSLLAQQMATHIALGRGWLGNACKRRKVLMIATEDDDDELTIRQQDINADLGIKGADLDGWLDLVPRVGLDNYLVRFLGDVGETTRAYRELERYIAETRPEVMIADNILQLLAGDPSKSEHATYFCNRILALKRKYQLTTMLVGHVPKNNAAIGYFGSIAWKASIRSHLVLKKHETEKGIRVLMLPKANYAESDDDGIEMTWDKGVLAAQNEELMSYGQKLERQMRESQVDQVFLKALDRLNKIQFSVSHLRNRNDNYAPDIIVQRELNEDATLDEIERAMKRLENRDVIRRQQELPWKRAGSRHPAIGWARV